jgi:hypothetical protein
MVLMAMLTALVVILTYAGSFIRLSPMVTVSLTLVPIVLGAVLCGVWGGTWLGLVNAIVILASGQAAFFFGISPAGTVIVVLAKGTLCGLIAALMYRVLCQWNKYAAIVTAAVICPIVNTGIFLLGCVLFFFETIQSWGMDAGFANAAEYMFLGLAGGNFLFELAFNLVLSPVIVRLLQIRKRM